MADEQIAGDLGSDESDNNSETTNGSESDDEQDVPATNTKDWQIDRELDTADEMKAYFQENKQWKKKTYTQNQSGTKEYYYCNVNGRSLPNKCPAQLCILKKKTTTNCLLMRPREHNHDENRESKRVAMEVREKIKEYLQQGLTHRLISHKLRTDENIIKAPTKNQVCATWS